MVETPFLFVLDAGWGSHGQSLTSTNSPNMLKWDGDSDKDFISTTDLTKRGVLPKPDISVKVASLKHPM